MRILPVPPSASDDPEAMELVRGWVVDGKLTVTLAAWVWKNSPETWGQFLADMAGHAADAIAKELGQDREHVYAKIRERLIADLEDSPRNLTGDFVDRTQ
jgi:predicted dehydrogenase